ncbi:predicted protein [Botrytis cinerea T4]|uniref:Uncharacterized protein n=1 Tax=Botryotinia fuckeliana (strain T4) TaxID=999810 RepID=G2XQL9_BOTF4|nr:predicted protein [Botrytis cinerea T4]
MISKGAYHLVYFQPNHPNPSTTVHPDITLSLTSKTTFKSKSKSQEVILATSWSFLLARPRIAMARPRSLWSFARWNYCCADMGREGKAYYTIQSFTTAKRVIFGNEGIV